MTVPFMDYRTPITGFMAALWSLQLKESQGHFLKDFSLIKFTKFTFCFVGGMVDIGGKRRSHLSVYEEKRNTLFS